jgi:catechol 2,3-dioxygenase-like lactoylglutathione lyase family enzyme
MAIARFKELCLDTDGDGEEVGRFWAAATGCEYTRTDHPDDAGDVTGPVEGMGISVCRVPEPKTVKNRVHLDLHTDAVATLVGLGAVVLPEQHDEDPWTVMADPDGNELCAFVREPDRVPAYKVYELAVDCADAAAIGRWWADVLGVELRHEEGKPWCWLEEVPGVPFEAWVFGPVPEPKTVKDRMHWDLYGDPQDLLAAGASRLWEVPGRTRPIAWTVLADPEGNEFCVFPES